MRMQRKHYEKRWCRGYKDKEGLRSEVWEGQDRKSVDTRTEWREDTRTRDEEIWRIKQQY